MTHQVAAGLLCVAGLVCLVIYALTRAGKRADGESFTRTDAALTVAIAVFFTVVAFIYVQPDSALLLRSLPAGAILILIFYYLQLIWFKSRLVGNEITIRKNPSVGSLLIILAICFGGQPFVEAVQEQLKWPFLSLAIGFLASQLLFFRYLISLERALGKHIVVKYDSDGAQKSTNAPTKAERPPAVTLICFYYALSFIVTLFILGLFIMRPELPAAVMFKSLSSFQIGASVATALCSLAGALALFFLRRQALYFFGAALLLQLVVFSTFARDQNFTMGITAAMMLIPVLITAYTWKLFKSGTLS